MSLASALPGDYIVCYRLEEHLGQTKLRLWEPILPSRPAADTTAPYLYIINFTFRTTREAEVFLRNHLLSNGAFDVPESHFPQEGRVEILPFPTWNLETI